MQSESLPLPEVEFIEFGTDQWKQELFASVNSPAVSESNIGQAVVKFDGRNTGSLNSQRNMRKTVNNFVVYDYEN